MGLNLSAIHLRPPSLDAFSQSVGPMWTRHIQGDRENRRRQLLILFRAPWITLVDSRSELPREMALELSRVTEGEAVWLEVAGTMLAVRCVRAINGETVVDPRIPDPKEPDLLPRFADAELEGWNFLKKCGIPPDVRFLRVRDIAAAPIKGKQQGDMILLERKAPGEEPGHGYFTHSIKSPRKEEDGPPDRK